MAAVAFSLTFGRPAERASNRLAPSAIPVFIDLPAATAFVVTSAALACADFAAGFAAGDTDFEATWPFDAATGFEAAAGFVPFAGTVDFDAPDDFTGVDFDDVDFDDPAGFEEIEARPVRDAAARDVPLRARLVTGSPRGGDGSAWLAGVGS